MAPDDANRRLLRLQGYDYSQAGEYFITVCVRDRAHLFGQVIDSRMRLSPVGEIARHAWRSLQEWFPYVILDCYALMPNHIHGVLLLMPENQFRMEPANGGRENKTPAERDSTKTGTPPKSLCSVIQAYKSAVTREYHQQFSGHGQLWQRGYYDHVIRDERGLERIRDYVTWNPAQWELDKENPRHTALNPFYAWLEKYSGAPPL